METVVALVAFGIIYAVAKANKNRKVNNYDITKVDNSKMARDAGLSYSQIQTNMINGKYDKDR